jgi:NADH-quinone oxidoreductase subunit L
MAEPMLDLVWLVVALPLAGAAVNAWLAFRKPDARGLVSAVGVGSVAAACGVAAAAFAALREPGAPESHRVRLWDWMSTGVLRLELAFVFDHLAAVLLLVITGVGALIHLYSTAYMRDDAGYARYFAYLNLFVACMAVLVLGASLPVMFIGWEGVGLCSYLLIGFWYTEQANADAGKKAFIVNRVGDAAVLLAMFLLFQAFGTLDFAGIAERVAGDGFVRGDALLEWMALLLFIGCIGKSAQVPLYVWLPDAMAGPTPVSALIHAATMVTAGVYLIVRTSFLFALSPFAAFVVTAVGALTALFAALIGLKQYDIKKVLAYSTVSQLGYMFAAVGAGAWTAGVFHLVTHAFFKALLFLGAGNVIHAMHHALHSAHRHDDPQDMRNMGGLRSAMPWTFGLMLLATLAIAGVPPLSGFFSKDAILGAVWARSLDEPLYRLCWAGLMGAALLTAIYMMRMVAMTFLGATRLPDAAREAVHEAPWTMTGPLAILGVLAAIGGVLNLPELVGGHEALAAWLAPVTAAARSAWPLQVLSHEAEYPLVGAAIGAGVIGLLIGWRLVVTSPPVPAAEAPADRGFAAVLANGFHVNELYDAAIVRPMLWLSRRVLWQGVDKTLVDGIAVNGLARLFQGAGWLGSRAQTGHTGLYAALFVVGVVVVLATLIR